MGLVRPVSSIGLAMAVAVTPLQPLVRDARAQILSKTDYEACQLRDDGAFRAKIEDITRAALTRSIAKFDAPAAVADAWRSSGVNDAIDKRVDIAVGEVGNETSWGDKLKSLAYTEKAQELAKNVAERVYRSDAVRAALEAVATDVNRKLGSSLEFASQDAATPAVACVKAFLGQRYGSAVSSSVSTHIEAEYGIDAKGRATIDTGSMLAQSKDGIAGAAILLVRRQLANMAERVGARIVGSVLSRLVTVAAGGVGAVLIAMDLWKLSGGVLPIISDEMKAASTKNQVQAELATSIKEQIDGHVKEIASKSADHILSIWQDFKRSHTKALELADQHPDFRTFLDVTASANLPRLDEVVGLLLAAEGDAGILKRLRDGTLDGAVNALPAAGMDIARETRSIDTAMKWSAVSGGLLPKVVDNELYRRASPDDFTRGSLTRLVELDDKLAIGRLSELKRPARETLFELGEGDLKLLARALPTDELSALAGYLTGLDKPVRERVLRAVALAPGKMRLLASPRVRTAVLASRNQSLAVDMMLRTDINTPAEIIADGQLAMNGDISPILMWERHPAAILALIVPVLIVFALLRRLLAPGRRPRAPLPSA